MTGGNIIGNSAVTDVAGGVYIDSKSTFSRTGGKIIGNYAKYSAGVYNEGKFTMDGGSIEGNVALESAGGVCIVDNGTFTMTGGLITGNVTNGEGGGVCISDNGTFNVSGTPVIKDNTNGVTVSNVYLEPGRYVTVIGALTAGAEIRIAYPYGTAAQFGQNNGKYTLVNSDAACFITDIAHKAAEQKDGKVLQWTDTNASTSSSAAHSQTTPSAGTPASPAPFIGIIAGLGAAAVLVLRRK